MYKPLTDHEKEVLLERCPRELRDLVQRLLAENTHLHEAQGERESMYGLEGES